MSGRHLGMNGRTGPTGRQAPARGAQTGGPLDALWRPRVLIWIVLCGEALAFVLAFAPGAGVNRLVYFGLASLLVQWILLLAGGALYTLRDALAAVPPVRVAWVALALLVLSTATVTAIAWVLFGGTTLAPGEDWPLFAGRAIAITFCVSLLGVAAFHNYWTARQHALAAQQAELAALHARIHPHFLFNTLNTAIALVRARPDAAEQVLLDLADLFRVALGAPREIPLRAELELARRYLDIEQLRLGARLRVDWNVPERLPEVGVPALSIQPLIENAVRHGVERRAEGGAIEVAAAVGAERVRITVRNPLPAEGAPEAPGHRIGQSAVRARLEASGTGGRLETRDDGTSYTAVLTLPLDGGDQASTR